MGRKKSWVLDMVSEMKNNKKATQKKTAEKAKPRSTSFQAEYITDLILEFLLMDIESSMQIKIELAKYPYYNNVNDLIAANKMDEEHRRKFDEKFPAIELSQRQIERYRTRAREKITANVINRPFYQKKIGIILMRVVRDASNKGDTRDQLAAIRQIRDLFGIDAARKLHVTAKNFVGSINDLERSLEDIDIEEENE